ncbi:T9SS type A sorting domain-containing protein [Hymenobacter sp. IS2118]|uniref:T9SS type A sorting domain-containing protein n=1 Tax=Hymenobacter sp. IS2118 TaxID=1505605 RepID=UPI0009E04171|nr:T9SS type A sorting domain-containing protein [Hymenobacter sp. IS2118]
MTTSSKYRFVSILVVLALGAADVQAQSRRPEGLMSRITHATSKHELAGRPLKTQRAITASVERPRQAVTYSWNTTTNRWDSAIKMETVYDANGRPAQETSSDSVTAVPVIRSLYTYTAQGQPASITQQVWGIIANNTWGNAGRQLYAYDAQGRETQSTQQTWTNNAWANTDRYLTTYDARGNETEFLQQTWNGSAWRTEYGSQTDYTYNAAGVLLEEIDKEWDNGVFRLEDRTVYTLVNGQWRTVLYQERDNNAWVNDEQIVDIVWHDWARLLPASYRQQEFNGTAFVDTERNTITYSSNGGTVETRQDYVVNAWVNAERYTDFVDVRGNSVGYDYEVWTKNAWVIEEGSRLLLTFNANNTLVRLVGQFFDDTQGRLVNSFRVNYSNFQSFVLATARNAALESRATLSPNPATSWVTLEVANVRGTAAATGEVRNALGQLVQRFTAQPQQGTITTKLDLSSLRAGVYTVRLQTGDGALVKRVVRD